jgi:hypothetical protein
MLVIVQFLQIAIILLPTNPATQRTSRSIADFRRESVIGGMGITI